MNRHALACALLWALVWTLLSPALWALDQRAAAGEKLVYAVCHKASDYTAARPEIFSIDPETGEKQLVFSDRHSTIVLTQHLYVFHFPAAGGGKIFAYGALRGAPPTSPGKALLCELSTDGSNTSRVICPAAVEGSGGDIFANSAGTRLGYIGWMKGKQYIFIHDVATGALLRKADVSDFFRDLSVASIGWLPLSDSLYFSLEAGDDDLMSDEHLTQVGSYLADGSIRQSRQLPAVPAFGGLPAPDAARVIGVLPSGEYLYETARYTGAVAPEITVIRVGADSTRAQEVTGSPSAWPGSGTRLTYRLSSSGRYLASAALPVSSTATSYDVWLKDLVSRAESTLVSIPTQGFQGPFLGLVGWIEQSEGLPAADPGN
ncbi:MAG: hypothetical protein WAW06_04580 [bacterium]